MWACMCVSVCRQKCSDNCKGKMIDILLQFGMLFTIKLNSKVKATNLNSWLTLAIVLIHGYSHVASEEACSLSNF